MYVVIGSWRMSPDLVDAQRAGLEGIVAGVSQLPGLVTGFWTSSGEGLDSRTFIVFESLDAAEAFASSVRGNLDNQRAAGVANVSLTVEEIIARTSE